MENVVDLIATGKSASEISDSIKDILFSKSAEKIDKIRPEVSNQMFNNTDEEG
jgi:hypothetical protein